MQRPEVVGVIRGGRGERPRFRRRAEVAEVARRGRARRVLVGARRRTRDRVEHPRCTVRARTRCTRSADPSCTGCRPAGGRRGMLRPARLAVSACSQLFRIARRARDVPDGDDDGIVRRWTAMVVAGRRRAPGAARVAGGDAHAERVAEIARGERVAVRCRPGDRGAGGGRGVAVLPLIGRTAVGLLVQTPLEARQRLPLLRGPRNHRERRIRRRCRGARGDRRGLARGRGALAARVARDHDHAKRVADVARGERVAVRCSPRRSRRSSRPRGRSPATDRQRRG